jgi:hypothetical protein
MKALALPLLALLACRASPEEIRDERDARHWLASQVDLARAYAGDPELNARKISSMATGEISRARPRYIEKCGRCASARTCEDEARRIEAVGTGANNDTVCR